MNASLVNQHNKSKKERELAQNFETVGNDKEPTAPEEQTEPAETAPPEAPEATETPSVTSIDDIFATIENKPKKKDKVPVTIYIDEDVRREFNKFGKQYGKGAKSELINTFLKSKFLK